MQFGPVPAGEAAGATLAHSIRIDGKRLPKGTVLDAAMAAKIAEAGHGEIIVARGEAGDLSEDEAARRLALPLTAPDLSLGDAATGRVNLHAGRPGLLSIDIDRINAFNAVDPALTIATLPNGAMVRERQMVATVKIIPFFVSEHAVEEAVKVLDTEGPAVRLSPFRPMRVALIQTNVDGTANKMLDKTAAVTAARLARAGSAIAREMRVPHETGAVTEALSRLIADYDMLIVFGASAVCDFDDVIPAAIRRSGGSVERVGMPVDPGNLLVLGSLDGKPVVGAPGCARSPKENGFDWVLDRILVGRPPSSADIAAMGVGGLLQEIETRPRPREANQQDVSVSAIILAAGRSRRMGENNKLMALFDGEPAIRRVACQAVESSVAETILVTGHEAERIGEAVADLPLSIVHNGDFADGMAGSLRKGLECIGAGHGAMVLLGDMPKVTAEHIDRMIEEFRRQGGRAVIRGGSGGRAGNPVILPAGIVREAARLSGDTGARHLIEASGAPTALVEIGEAAMTDIDTPDALAAAGGRFAG